MQTKLDVRPNSSSLEFPEFKMPIPIGSFSINCDRLYEPSNINLRYFKHPPKELFPLDLNLGVELATRKPESANNERLDSLLRFIIDNHQKLLQYDTRRQYGEKIKPLLATEFICWRGLLSLILGTPYETKEDWCIHVTRFHGTFYLCKYDTEEAEFKRENETDQMRKMCSWGFKFEQFCLVESPDQNPDIHRPVNENEEFSCVFRSRLAGLDLLYGAEVDGILKDSPVNNDELTLKDLEFVELKTREGNLPAWKMRTYRNFKARKWWCQSFLIGIKKIIVGLRDEKGFVESIEHVSVKALPKLSDQWQPAQCFQFLIRFLNYIKQIMLTIDCPYTTYGFYYSAKNGEISYRIHHGSNEYSMLSEYYINFLNKLSKQNE